MHAFRSSIFFVALKKKCMHGGNESKEVHATLAKNENNPFSFPFFLWQLGAASRAILLRSANRRRPLQKSVRFVIKTTFYRLFSRHQHRSLPFPLFSVEQQSCYLASRSWESKTLLPRSSSSSSSSSLCHTFLLFMYSTTDRARPFLPPSLPCCIR
jgi:hypothetical protein